MEAKLEIPQDALQEEVELSVEKAGRAPAGNEGDAFRFGPEGLVFKKPAKLFIGHGSGKYKIATVDDRLGELVLGLIHPEALRRAQ